MTQTFESKGRKFLVQNYSKELVTKHINELLEIDKVIKDYPGSKEQTKPWTLKNFTYPLENKEKLSFLVLFEGKAIAFMIASSYSNKSHLSRIAALEEYQGYGVGSILVSLLEKESEKLGLSEVTLSTTYTGENDKISRWYEKRGYNILRDKESIMKFLEMRNKLHDKELFYPSEEEGKLIIMNKLLQPFFDSS